MTPKRIQRKRTRGWRMPEGCIYVGRPTKWGNPFKVENGESRADAVRNFRGYVLGRLSNGTGYPLRELRGKNLACWCPLGKPCHADVLLELANSLPASLASGRSVRRCDEEICAPDDIAEIAHVAIHRHSEYSNCLNILRAHRLVRQGFMSRCQHSEQVRGERRFYWWRFEVTAKGKQLLQVSLQETP